MSPLTARALFWRVRSRSLPLSFKYVMRVSDRDNLGGPRIGFQVLESRPHFPHDPCGRGFTQKAIDSRSILYFTLERPAKYKFKCTKYEIADFFTACSEK